MRKACLSQPGGLRGRQVSQGKEAISQINVCLHEPTQADLQNFEKKYVVVVQVIQLWSTYNAATAKSYSSALGHFVLFHVGVRK